MSALIGKSVDSVVQKMDVNAIVDKIDLNALLEKVDLDRLIERIDVSNQNIISCLCGITANDCVNMTEHTVYTDQCHCRKDRFRRYSRTVQPGGHCGPIILRCPATND